MNTSTENSNGQSLGADTAAIRGGAAAKIHELMKDVDGLVGRVADLKDPAIAEVRTKVHEALSGAREALAERTRSLRDQGGLAANVAVDFVKENPWKSLGIAGLVGITVALLAARRD